MPSEWPEIEPTANSTVAESLRAKKKKGPAKAKAKAKAKDSKKKKKGEGVKPGEKDAKKTEKKKDKVKDEAGKKKQGQSSYGIAKEECRAKYKRKGGDPKQFEGWWRNSAECQAALRSMSWPEVKKRKLEYLWNYDLDWVKLMLNGEQPAGEINSDVSSDVL